jgi:[acyl-carrier-protein] S-malonyltransferase
MTEPHVAAWVGERPIPVAVIEDRLDALRRGPHAGRLPQPGTAEARNLRRWLTQTVTTEAVVEYEAHRRGLIPDDNDPPPPPVTIAEALQSGGVTAAILATQPLARTLRRAVVGDVAIPDEQVYDYYLRNRDRHGAPYPEVRDQIRSELAEVEQRRRFARWLDERYAQLVRLLPGFEHPADPHHADATHRH